MAATAELGGGRGNRMCLAIPGKVLTAYDKNGLPMARVQFGAVTREACLAYTPEAVVGDYVLVHVGFAISRINEEEAQRTYQALLELDQLTELEAPVVEERAPERTPEPAPEIAPQAVPEGVP